MATIRTASYVRFVDVVPMYARPTVEVRTRSGDVLGGIAWYGRWREYVFVPDAGTVYSEGCLQDIVAKVGAMNRPEGESK